MRPDRKSDVGVAAGPHRVYNGGMATIPKTYRNIRNYTTESDTLVIPTDAGTFAIIDTRNGHTIIAHAMIEPDPIWPDSLAVYFSIPDFFNPITLRPYAERLRQWELADVLAGMYGTEQASNLAADWFCDVLTSRNGGDPLA